MNTPSAKRETTRAPRVARRHLRRWEKRVFGFFADAAIAEIGADTDNDVPPHVSV
jgi:hypothetical protein